MWVAKHLCILLHFKPSISAIAKEKPWPSTLRHSVIKECYFGGLDMHKIVSYMN